MTAPVWLIAIWLVCSIGTPLIVMAGIFWLRRAFVTGSDLAAVRQSIEVEARRTSVVNDAVVHLDRRIVAAEGRLDALEDHNGEPPSRLDLSKDIGKVAERVRGLETAVDALKRIGETTNSYLHTVIEQGIRK